MGNSTDSISKYRKMNINESIEKIFVLLGETGVGKSSFINGITQTQNCEIGDDSSSCTKNIKMVNKIINGTNFYIIDTPGFQDSNIKEEKIIEILQDLRKYQRICSILICLKYNETKLSKYVKKILMEIMNIFPSKDFWEHTLIIRTWCQLSDAKLENHKHKYDGILLQGINNDQELIKFMQQKNINPPSELLEFYVDSDTEIDERTEEEYQKILEKIKKLLPLYKDVQFKDIEDTFEKIEGNINYLNIITYREYTFTDFNDSSKIVTNKINQERYNLNNYKPIFSEVKRVQEKEPRGILCWSSQYKTHYIAVKTYEINHEQRREEYEIDWRYEGKEIKDIEDGEERRETLYKALKAQINANEIIDNDKVLNFSEKPPNNHRGNIYSEK